MSVKRIIVIALKVLLAATVIYFAGRQLVGNWAQIADYEWKINPFLLVLSVVLHLVTFVAMSRTWCLLMNAFGFRIPLKSGFKVAYIANLGRYIPGKIWPVFGMIYLLKQIDVNKETAFTSWGIATILGLPPAFLVGVIAIAFRPEMVSGSLSGGLGIGPVLALVATLALSLVLILAPDKTTVLINWVTKLLRRPSVNFRLDKKVALQVYLGYFVSWILYGASFYTFVNAIMTDPGVPVVAGIGSFALAYLIGYLAVFSPGGLGAREWVLTTLLTPFLGPVAAGVAVAARVWNLIVEFIAAAIALVVKLEK
ncbi:MAG: flippase-like domain-containing protein [candidate division Zixibacteria bacterium]|nr:flippase-like domain-containing protein [candidate division Zixibacteria bacterium]